MTKGNVHWGCSCALSLPGSPQPCGSHWGGETCPGTYSSQTRPAGLCSSGNCLDCCCAEGGGLAECLPRCFPRASERLGSDLLKVPLLPLTGSAQGGPAHKQMQSLQTHRAMQVELAEALALPRLRPGHTYIYSGVSGIQPPPAMGSWRII